ncbi:MAG: cytochrome C [Armatimonadetes bacterium CG07_land_8_20_14_0_80_59_28]|nr:MAG: cytochrome C [Armatimonadetes bacterium CG07_land_8_20_14_0_80_59_28]PIX44158.1 MAG: cytochrome C [Armatimonadetes bacterium CG_4_8_14_3_um_filter_58_9]PIY47525.1 MAG: cytochrome C [Armatimonadetes bacterium CG_4_10_14_3_um_filter_59_10]
MNLPSCAVISLILTLAGALVLFSPKEYARVGNQSGYAPVQPINFSHKVHAKDNSIPCEHCHSAARKSPVAGVPAANVCMNCHSEILKDSPEVRKIYDAVKDKRPIEWVRVHDCADFVRFDHSAHVTKGVPCQSCHGKVETMSRVQQVSDLSMGWCVNCHRQMNKKPLKGMKNVKASVECSTCHY